MGTSPPPSSSSSFCDEIELKRGPWTPEEDEKLVAFITQHGHGSWRALPKLAGLNRCGKSCRLRWTNYLRPDIKRGKFSEEEQQTILNLHSILGNKWSVIASQLPGRTDNEIKNFWNTHLKKKLIQMGFDPITHMPSTNYNNTISPHHLLPLPHLQKLLLFDLPPLEHQLEALLMAPLHEYLHHLLGVPPSHLFTPTFLQPLQYDNGNMSAPFAHNFPGLLDFCGLLSDDPTSTPVHRRPDVAAVSGGANPMWVSSNSPPPPLPMEPNSHSQSPPLPDVLIFNDYEIDF